MLPMPFRMKAWLWTCPTFQKHAGRSLSAENLGGRTTPIVQCSREGYVVGWAAPGRSCARAYFDDVVAEYSFRNHVKPGITGWAQVKGFRGPAPTVDLMEKRVRYDLWYMNNWSFWLDLKIVLRTFVNILASRKAY